MILLPEEQFHVGLLLTDEEVLTEGRNLTIMLRLLASIVTFRRFRKHLTCESRIDQDVVGAWYSLNRAANNGNIGIGVQAGRLNFDSKIAIEHDAGPAL